jgi:hypothetical protein
MVQCEIIQQNMLGGQPQDEDPVPEATEDGQQLPLAFCGLGQALPSAGLDLNFPPVPFFRFSLKTIFRENGISGLLMFNELSRFSRTFNWMSSRSAINTLACLRTAL